MDKSELHKEREYHDNKEEQEKRINMAVVQCSNCHREYDKDYFDGVYLEGFGEDFWVCTDCEPDMDFFYKVVESMQKLIDYKDKEIDRYANKNADYIIEIKTIMDACEQALK